MIALMVTTRMVLLADADADDNDRGGSNNNVDCDPTGSLTVHRSLSVSCIEAEKREATQSEPAVRLCVNIISSLAAPE